MPNAPTYATTHRITIGLHGSLKKALFSVAKETDEAGFILACALCNIERNDAKVVYSELTYGN